MNLLFYSDLHLALGPREPIRPELRRLWCKLGWCGERMMNRFEDRLRMEAKRIQRLTRYWLNENAGEFDLLVNGGDLAMPLSHHEDRMDAARKVWSMELDLYGEDHYFALTGNHELGHGYDPDPGCYQELMGLRAELFRGEINRNGYGRLDLEGSTLLMIDSELLSVAETQPYEPFVIEHLARMREIAESALDASGPLVLLTHNTARVRRWLVRSRNLWNRYLATRSHFVMIGGHFHIPRVMRRSKAEIHWTGGGSYPEPFLRYLPRLPLTGVLNGGAGAVEIQMEQGVANIMHRAFNHPRHTQTGPGNHRVSGHSADRKIRKTFAPFHRTA